jgi:hypothetical protein
VEVRLDTETTADELGGLTNSQIVALIDNLLANRGPQGASRDELLQLVEMASDARDNWHIFASAIEGRVVLDIVDGELRVGLPVRRGRNLPPK